MDWLDQGLIKPSSRWQIVIVTDGEFVWFARWIDDPISWYGKDLEDENGEKLDEEWHQPHWLYEINMGKYIDNDPVFGIVGEVSHWMPIPKPPILEESSTVS